MPVSKKRDKKGRFTKHAKQQRVARSNKRIREIKSLLAQADEWESQYKEKDGQ